MALTIAVLLAIFVLPGPWSAIVIVGGAVFEVGESVFWYRWSRRRRAQVGAETLIGATGTVETACMPLGQVRVRGELWRAECAAGAGEGERVRVVGRDGLTLNVEPL